MSAVLVNCTACGQSLAPSSRFCDECGTPNAAIQAAPAPAAPVVRPLWITLVSGGLAVIGSAAVVEAVNLPVRFDQSGFEKSNWLMIIAMILVFYWILSAILARLSARRVGGTTITTHE